MSDKKKTCVICNDIAFMIIQMCCLLFWGTIHIFTNASSTDLVILYCCKLSVFNGASGVLPITI